MKRSTFSEAQIAFVLKQAEDGTTIGIPETGDFDTARACSLQLADKEHVARHGKQKGLILKTLARPASTISTALGKCIVRQIILGKMFPGRKSGRRSIHAA